MDKISIIIRSKNEERYIGQVLDGIFSQKIDIPFEVIVIDSGSTDRTLEILTGYDIRLFCIPAESFTFGYALNYGAERADGNIICNLSAHCIPVNNLWLKELILPIKNSSCQATFGRQVPIKGVNALEEVELKKLFPESHNIIGRVPFSNANCAFLKELWQEMKFDEKLPSWEDYLWYLLLNNKYKFYYCPAAAVYHSHPFSIKYIVKRAYNDGKAFKMIKNQYNIDLLDGDSNIMKLKLGTFIQEVKYHVRLCRESGFGSNILLIGIVKFLVNKAFRDGYASV